MGVDGNLVIGYGFSVNCDDVNTMIKIEKYLVNKYKCLRTELYWSMCTEDESKSPIKIFDSDDNKENFIAYT